MISTAIILAGGFGTRLLSVVKDLPKPMADISGKPFLEYVLNYLQQQGIKKSILSVGYKWYSIKSCFGDSFGEMKLEYIVEDSPLGTGGAILKAVNSSKEKEFFIFNGDTFFNIDLAQLEARHELQNTKLSIALKPMKNFDRYGVVQTDSENNIISFQEKKFYEEGNINGGIYILHRDLFSGFNFSEKFSFEKDVMEKYCTEKKFAAFSFDDYFIDIGIPEDYKRAQIELPALVRTHNFRLPASDFQFSIDNTWTLFLDRDGVINRKIDSDYVRNIDQFEWLPGVQESILLLSKIFGRIIIVTNQQGVGKGLMKNEEVKIIHDYIIKATSDFGGKIDKVYFAPQLKNENSLMRKPGIGMALEAKKDFPEIDFSKSIMVGDSLSDMEFGKTAGMKTIFISQKKSNEKNNLIDRTCNSLQEMTEQLS